MTHKGQLSLRSRTLPSCREAKKTFRDRLNKFSKKFHHIRVLKYLINNPENKKENTNGNSSLRTHTQLFMAVALFCALATSTTTTPAS